MEPVVLTCDACGARIRSSNPARARTRPCPRCQGSLAPAVDRWAAIEAAAIPGPAVEVEHAADRPTRPTRRARRWPTVAAALLATLGAGASLAIREPSIAGIAGLDRSAPPAVSAPPAPEAPALTVEPPPFEAEGEPAEPDALPVLPDLAASPAEAPVGLALRDEGPKGVGMPPPPPAPSGDLRPTGRPVIPAPPRPDRPEAPDLAAPPAPAPPKPDAAPAAAAPRRVLVRDPQGRAVVAREHGWHKGRMAAVLPDGQIGWPDGLVDTDRPFVPLSMEELRRQLQDTDFPTFRVQSTKHYLVFYQGSENFARASGVLLERLHDGLTDALKRFNLPVTPAEFPLVAVIFKTEDDFRANRKVAPDVQAYYEILSNRIYFYEKSSRDGESPEVAALRKPQTVAHEGTHQLLHNVGIQPRLSDWPLWLVEGFAEYCSPPKATKKGTDWAGLGQINPIHLATIRDLDDPVAVQVQGQGQGQGRVATPAIGKDRRVPLVEYLATRKELTPTDYALSWGLTHYLARQQVEPFIAYLRKMSRLKPFEDQSPEQQLAAFREAFGTDLPGIDARVGKYLARLKVPDAMALPYYAVLFEQTIGPQAIRRSAMVSQSPSVIRQWIESAPLPQGGPSQWHTVQGPTRARAFLAADQWMAEFR